MCQKEDYKYNQAFIIGNGFDIANGFPTSYGDFLESTDFKNLLSQDNQLAKYIRDKRNEAKWVDMEIEIGKYSFYGRSFVY